MKVNVGGGWHEGDLKVRLKDLGWIEPDRTLMKRDGSWDIVGGIEVLSMTAISDLLSDASGWVYHSTRGWYKDVRYVSADWHGLRTKFSPEFLSKLKRIRATFTSYYNNPEAGLGANLFLITLSDQSVVYLGTYDQWTSSARGLRIHKGDAGFEDQVLRNVLGERFTYTVPEGLSIIDLSLHSYGRVSDEGGTLYPYTLRGMRDFEFTLHH